MPRIEYEFKNTWLKWEVLKGGAQHTADRGVLGVDLDTMAKATGQAISELFTIDPVPEGAEDGQWDAIEFSFIYQHVNWIAKSALSDRALISVRIVDENQEVFDSSLLFQKFLMRENAPAGRFSGAFTASFQNLAPGKYRLFVGEADKGDGEPFRLSIYSGKAIEDIPDPVLPAISTEEEPAIREDTALARAEEEILPSARQNTDDAGSSESNGNTVAAETEDEVLSRNRRDLSNFGPTPESSSHTLITETEEEVLSWNRRDLSAVASPSESNGSNVDVPCFARGTIIETRHGPMRVEDIRKGCLIRTHQHDFQPVRWIGSQKLNTSDLRRNPHLRPIRIRAGALAAQTPLMDLIVSPQHRILIRSKPAQRMFGTNEILVAAKHLLEIDGIGIVCDQDEVEYFHFMFEQHEIVFANGAETESFYTGEQALQSVGKAAFSEICQIFPQLKNVNPMLPAVPFATGRRARQLIRRHVKNHLELVSCHHMRLN